MHFFSLVLFLNSKFVVADIYHDTACKKALATIIPQLKWNCGFCSRFRSILDQLESRGAHLEDTRFLLINQPGSTPAIYLANDEGFHLIQKDGIETRGLEEILEENNIFREATGRKMKELLSQHRDPIKAIRPSDSSAYRNHLWKIKKNWDSYERIVPKAESSLIQIEPEDAQKIDASLRFLQSEFENVDLVGALGKDRVTGEELADFLRLRAKSLRDKLEELEKSIHKDSRLKKVLTQIRREIHRSVIDPRHPAAKKDLQTVKLQKEINLDTIDKNHAIINSFRTFPRAALTELRIALRVPNLKATNTTIKELNGITKTSAVRKELEKKGLIEGEWDVLTDTSLYEVKSKKIWWRKGPAISQPTPETVKITYKRQIKRQLATLQILKKHKILPDHFQLIWVFADGIPSHLADTLESMGIDKVMGRIDP